MKKVIASLVFVLLFFMFGCENENKKILSNDNKSSTISMEALNSPTSSTPSPKINSQDESKIVSSDKSYVNLVKEINNLDAYGPSAWFNEWWVTNYDNATYSKKFQINSIQYETGLGIDGMTAEGEKDLRSSTKIRYKIEKMNLKQISGVFGFDDSTKVFGNTKLIITIDDSQIYSSPVLNEKLKYTDVNVAIPQNAKILTLQFDTTVVNNVTPRFVFADIRLLKE